VKKNSSGNWLCTLRLLTVLTLHIPPMKLLYSSMENTVIQHAFLKLDYSKKNRFSIKTPEPQIKQKNPRSSEKKQQWQHWRWLPSTVKCGETPTTVTWSVPLPRCFCYATKTKDLLPCYCYATKSNYSVILFSCIVPRTSACLLRADNYLAFVDCFRRGVGSSRLQFCSAVTVLLRPCMLFHLVYRYVAWSFTADSTSEFNNAFFRSHQLIELILAIMEKVLKLQRLDAEPGLKTAADECIG